MGVSWLFLVYSKEVVRVFQKGCKGIEKVVSKVFKARVCKDVQKFY